MAKHKGLLDRWVDGLPESKFFQLLARRILVPFWAWRTPVTPKPGGPQSATQPGDNIQNMMNLVMPLKDKSPIGRAKAAMAIGANTDEIYAGLDNVGTVHFARFLIVDNNLCMISVYDGDFTNYIRDFIATLGSVFDVIVALIEDGDDIIPSEENVEAFIEWVHKHDLYQTADFATEMLAKRDVGGEDLVNLRSLPRDVILQLRVNKSISLGSGYRGYAGLSAARVRQTNGLGW